jgi:DnaJ domain
MKLTVVEAHAVLGVAVSASADDKKRAYRKLALLSHPDKNRDDPTAKVSEKTVCLHPQRERKSSACHLMPRQCCLLTARAVISLAA